MGGASRLLLSLLGAYLALCLLALLFQRKLMYLPLRAPELRPRDWGLSAAEEVRFGDGIHGWWLRAPAERRRELAVVFCNGNAAHMGYRVPKARELLGLGLDVLLFDYPGYGSSAGSPSKKALVAAASAAYAEVGRRGSRVGLYGESIGAAVAVEVASQQALSGRPVAFLILEGAFSSAAELGAHHYWFLPVRWFLIDRFEPAAQIDRVGCPLLMLHAENDEVVPLALAQRLYQRAGEPKRLVILPRAGHNDLPFAAELEYRRAIADFLAALAPAPNRNPDA